MEPDEGKDLGPRTASPNDSQTEISRSNSTRSEKKTNDPIPKVSESSHSDASNTRQARSHNLAGEEALEQSSDPENKPEASGGGNSRPQEHGSALHKIGGPVHGIVQGLKYHISGAASTNELPDGRPESEMSTPKEHQLGHLGKDKLSS